jgi:hypothetical protein
LYWYMYARAYVCMYVVSLCIYIREDPLPVD